MHQILTLEIPFLEKDTFIESDMLSDLDVCEPQVDMSMISNYCSGRIPFPVGALQESGVGKEGIDFVKKLLVPDPRLRLSAQDALKSPWLLEDFTKEDRQHQTDIPPTMEGGPAAEQAKFLQSCHKRLLFFLKTERPSLVSFFPGDLDEVLRPYSEQAGKLALKLLEKGCPKDTARALGVLTLYDLVMLIGEETLTRVIPITYMLQMTVLQ